jgi:hypothetical protein
MISRTRDANLPGYTAQQNRTTESNQENEGSAYCVENQNINDFTFAFVVTNTYLTFLMTMQLPQGINVLFFKKWE